MNPLVISVVGLVDVLLLFDDTDWVGDKLADPIELVEPCDVTDPTEDDCGGYWYGKIFNGVNCEK